MKRERLLTYLSSRLAASRRKLFNAILNGVVSLNGAVSYDSKAWVDPSKDQVQLNGKTIAQERAYLYYKFHKPRDVVSTMDDPRGRKSLADFLGGLPGSLMPVGRLDRQSTGLLFFTNDGQFSNIVMHPKYQVKKRYRVGLSSVMKRRDLGRLLDGLLLEDGPVRFEHVDLLGPQRLEVVLTEGRNRIVRRAFAQLGYEVRKLKRLQIGPVSLGNLKEGRFSPISKKEVAYFLKLNRH